MQNGNQEVTDDKNKENEIKDKKVEEPLVIEDKEPVENLHWSKR